MGGNASEKEVLEEFLFSNIMVVDRTTTTTPTATEASSSILVELGTPLNKTQIASFDSLKTVSVVEFTLLVEGDDSRADSMGAANKFNITETQSWMAGPDALAVMQEFEVDSGFAVDSFTVETSVNGEASEVNTDEKSDGQMKKGTKMAFNAPVVIGFSVFAGIAVLIGAGVTLAMVVISANKKKVKSVHPGLVRMAKCAAIRPPQDLEVDTNFTHHRVDRVVIPGLAKDPLQRPKAAFQDP